MAKYTNPIVHDAALNKIATATLLLVCSAQPASRAEAITLALAQSAPLTGGSFTLANGDVSGRKVTVAQQTNRTIDVSGTATHVALVDGSDLLDVTTVVSQVLTAGGTVTIPSFKHELTDPS